MDCSVVHRKLGTHISTVKSLTLDTWKPQWIEKCQKVGNRVARDFYEHRLSKNFVKPTWDHNSSGGDTSRNSVDDFIVRKYEKLEWVPKGSLSPAALVEQGQDPDVYSKAGSSANSEAKTGSARSRRSTASTAATDAAPIEKDSSSTARERTDRERSDRDKGRSRRKKHVWQSTEELLIRETAELDSDLVAQLPAKTRVTLGKGRKNVSASDVLSSEYKRVEITEPVKGWATMSCLIPLEPLASGHRVELKGLTQNTQLNGIKAVIVGAAMELLDHSQGGLENHWLVDIPGTGHVQVHNDNVMLVDPAEDDFEDNDSEEEALTGATPPRPPAANLLETMMEWDPRASPDDAALEYPAAQGTDFANFDNMNGPDNGVFGFDPEPRAGTNFGKPAAPRGELDDLDDIFGGTVQACEPKPQSLPQVMQPVAPSPSMSDWMDFSDPPASTPFSMGSPPAAASGGGDLLDFGIGAGPPCDDDEVRKLAEKAKQAQQAAADAEKQLREAEAQIEAEKAEAEKRQAERLRKIEEARQAAEAQRAEAARMAEQAQRVQEAKRLEEARRKAEAEAEAARQAEARRQAAEAAKIEEARRAAEARKLHEKLRVEEQKRAEEERLAEEARAAYFADLLPSAAGAGVLQAAAHPATPSSVASFGTPMPVPASPASSTGFGTFTSAPPQPALVMDFGTPASVASVPLSPAPSSVAPSVAAAGAAPAVSPAASQGKKFCTECGTKAVPGAKFCGECGARMT